MKQITILILLLLSSIAFAQEGKTWQDSFDPEALKTYFSKDTKIIVTAAGEKSEELTDVAKTLEKSLKFTGKIALVMNDDALGDVSMLDDQAIIGKAKKYPVNTIAVIRLFMPNAVVTIYNKKGESVTAFSVEKGKKLEPIKNDTTSDTTLDGAGKKAAKAVDTILKESTEKKSVFGEKYDENYIWFQDFAAINQYGNVVSTWTTAYKGKYKKVLGWDEFYSLIGRDDLAERFTKIRNTKIGLYLASIPVSLGGLLLYMKGSFQLNNTTHEFNEQTGVWYETERNDYSSYKYGGIALMTAGLTSFVIALILDPHTIKPEQARKMADEYNQKLKGDNTSDNNEIKKEEKELFKANAAPYFMHNG